MRVTVDLDPRDVWRLEEQAEKRGVTPGEVLRDILALKHTARKTRERVREQVKAGKCDADIAKAIGSTNRYVAEIRRGLGLPANRRYPKRTTAASGAADTRRTA